MALKLLSKPTVKTDADISTNPFTPSESSFICIAQNNLINLLMKTTDKKKDIEDITSHQLKKATGAGCSILFRSLKAVDLRLFLFIVSKLCSLINIKNRAKEISLSVKEYQELTNQKDYCRTKEQMKESLARLNSVTLNQDDFSCKLFESVRTERSSFIIAYNKHFFSMISDEKQAFLTYIPADLFKLNLKKDSLSFFLGYKLFAYYRTRLTKKKQSKNKISIASLLSVCPELPTTDKNKAERIILPTSKALDRLENIKILDSWDYDVGVEKKEEEKADEETKAKISEAREKIERSYSLFKNSCINFELDKHINAKLLEFKAKATQKRKQHKAKATHK